MALGSGIHGCLRAAGCGRGQCDRAVAVDLAERHEAGGYRRSMPHSWRASTQCAHGRGRARYEQEEVGAGQ
ncbi:hypothetical protein SAM23877_7620 [Streptomyces ambofaciens ATCC 23877]|uniref:Uncharacterized protein n=1 Tax=Streptomyces ambofaciens (strain ATCC 23877 / 3486 / DSM 40053 / JCM 4204 / NBRC 12836 / NRRL B-2516) TaxID=278992 RepID=A0A0K2B679_STRA7|nr:hypothetical protein SAM23877_0050 [Streptomyces ambofaciens ATCC 23877]AKZ60661.1 hypothetical protein SAM23877_7620 [Streptomyces ambofaciens ATCC 23877]